MFLKVKGELEKENILKKRRNKEKDKSLKKGLKKQNPDF